MKLELRLSEEQRQGLIEAVREDSDVVTKMLVDIDITKAETSSDTDKALILKEIRALPGGEHGCNVDLKALMRRWVLETLEEAVGDSEHALAFGGMHGGMMTPREREMLGVITGEGGSASGAIGGNGEGARLEHARLLNQVAIVFQTNGSDYTKALELYGRALAIYEEVHGKHHLTTATTCNNMALVYMVQGDQAKALEFYGRALAIYEEVHGKHHPDTAGTYNNMAIAYKKQGDHAKALELFGRALAIREEVHGKHHPDTAMTCNNMAGVYYAQGDHAKALELYGRALAIKEEVHGKHHPDTAGTYYGMALAFGLIGESTQQREYFGKAATAYATCGVDNAQSRYAQKNA